MRRLLLTLLFLALPALGQAQTVVTAASGVSFTASADHASVAVNHYDLVVIAQNPIGALGFTFGLGKPAPDASNTITVKPIANFGALTTGTYTATVAAVGPGGTGVSVPSDPFVAAKTPAPPGKPSVVP